MNIRHTVLPNIRSIKVNLILNSIQNNESSLDLENHDTQKIAEDLEDICFKYANNAILPSNEGLNNPLCEEIYHLKIARCVGFFEDEKGFVKLFNKITSGDIKLEDFPDVDIAELFPERYTEQLARIDETCKDMVVKYSTLYHCRKCKQNKCSIQSAQTRSLDECNTIFVNCLSCGNSFTV